MFAINIIMLNYIEKLIEIKSITKLIIIFIFFIENNINILVIKTFSIQVSFYMLDVSYLL